jgi:ribulose-5-phosphate 4-epimerase/fuculose-1-phosphate aldolase
MELTMTTNKTNAYSDAEWRARVDLAAAYRLTEHFGMTTLVYNHITSRVPARTTSF